MPRILEHEPPQPPRPWVSLMLSCKFIVLHVSAMSFKDPKKGVVTVAESHVLDSFKKATDTRNMLYLAGSSCIALLPSKCQILHLYVVDTV